MVRAIGSSNSAPGPTTAGHPIPDGPQGNGPYPRVEEPAQQHHHRGQQVLAHQLAASLAKASNQKLHVATSDHLLSPGLKGSSAEWKVVEYLLEE